MDYKTYLEHYGVLGMHWGVRKEEDLVGRRRGESESGSNSSSSRKVYNYQKNQYTTTSNREGQGMTEKQKRLIKRGLMVAGLGLAAYGTYRFSKAGGIQKLLTVTKKPKIDLNDMKVDPSLQGGLSELELEVEHARAVQVLGKVNPHYTTKQTAETFMGSNMNCGNCGIASELNWRGEKVFAKLNESGMLPEQLATYFKLDKTAISSFRIKTVRDGRNVTGADLTAERGIKIRAEIDDHIFRTFPEGSRGMIAVPHLTGSHYMTWRRTPKGVVIDNPQNLDLDLNQQFMYSISRGTPGSDRYGIQAVRLDNAAIDRTHLDEIVTTNLEDKVADFETYAYRGGNAVAKMFGNGKTFPKEWGIKKIK